MSVSILFVVKNNKSIGFRCSDYIYICGFLENIEFFVFLFLFYIERLNIIEFRIWINYVFLV